MVSRYQGHPVLVVYMAVEGRLAAVLVLGDGLRADAVSAVTRLRNAGVRRSIMLTGDDADAANRIAATLPLDLVVADASPADKVAVVNAESSKAATMMVGDGINDAPALAMATVGVAMGARGATASSEAADVVVLTDSLGAVATAVEIASRTTMIARQSIVAGIGLSALAMIAAAFGFLSPVSGALLQEAIDVAVILNALRALGDHGKRKMGYQ